VTVSIPALSIAEELSVSKDGLARFAFDTEPQRWSPASPLLYDVSIAYGEDKVDDRARPHYCASRAVPLDPQGLSLASQAAARHPGLLEPQGSALGNG